MSFEANTGFLKADFVMSFVLALLGIIILGTMSSNSYKEFLIAAGGVALFAMDFVTWKRSERFKGKRASVAALLICPIMAFFAFATSIVIGVGIKDFCNSLVYHPERCSENVKEIAGLRAGVAGSALAGILFVAYGLSEYAQYRKRHVQGDKW
ncbi:hypothetical protein BGZ83_006675 [Gryganskiella cystojenkinii]|nr:hypothetical protein BGZ83_006675 [Gryganskiella cystojenkinii]